MRKSVILLSLINLIPMTCMANIYDDRIAELLRQKQEKMDELDKCSGSKKSLKIAGISTLGLTAAGVAGNVAEAVVLKKKNAEIDSIQQEIDTTNASIDKKKAEIAAEEERVKQQQQQEEAQRTRNLLKIATEDIDNITVKTSVNLGDYIVTRGYLPENLPDNLRSLFVNAAKNWVDLCRKNISGDIAEVTASADKIKIVKASSVYAEDFVLNSLTPIQYISCFVESCKNKKVPNATRTECVVDEVKDFASLCTAQQGASVLYGTNGKCSFGSGKTQEEVTSKCNAITSGGVKTYVKQIGVDFVCVTNQEAVWDGENFKQNMNACKCDDKSGGLYCDLDDATRTRCVIRTCKDSNKIPDVKGLKCVDKTDANIVTKQSDGNVVVADVDVVTAEGQNCRSDVYVADNVISAKYVKNQKGGLTCQLTCSGNMIGKLDYDLEKYKCVVDTNADQVNLTGKSFKQKCDILTGIVDGVEYTGGYFTEKRY